MVEAYQLLNDFNKFKPRQIQITEADVVIFVQYQKQIWWTKNNNDDNNYNEI